MSDIFTEEQLEEYKETFSLFDKEGDGTIATNELGTVLRALGQHPTEADLSDLISTLEVEGHATVEFPAFLNILAKIIKDTDPETELTEAFKLFDKENTGNISNADLRRIMTTYGEVLNDEEVEEMIKEADTDGDGIVDYAEFISMVIQP
ncbi:neo-calmodulin-like [Mya arenaria]|uniref:neo-calmodulin-like n=1 Tax=Mya arenaria TaxID=6604 RepID=UPI0022E8400C|nr:neo-calmodulin-like [Mya arenaria]XP_052767258.1 neo-calmodulin-like [Mya arenaria]